MLKFNYCVVFITLIYIDFFGLLPRIPLVQFIADLVLLFSVSLILIDKDRRVFLHSTLLKSLIYFCSFLVIYVIYTLSKGGVTLVDLYKMIRIYFPLLLTVLIAFDIAKYRNERFYVHFFFTIGCVVTLFVFLIGVIKVEWFASAPRLSYDVQEGEYDFGLRRVYMFSSFIFPIACFIYSFTKYLSKRDNTNVLLLTIFSVGLLIQGYRSYIIATVISIGFIYFLSKKNSFFISAIKRRRFIVALIIIIFLSSVSPAGRGLINRIKTGVTDFVGVEGTFAGRLAYDAFRFKVFLEHPVFGIGLVHQNSERARQLGARSFEEIDENTSDQKRNEIGFYALRSTDSGYLDVLVLYGLVGGVTFYLMFGWLFLILKKIKRVGGSIEDIQATRIFLLVLFITQISHSGFSNEYGQIPLAFLLGLVFGKLCVKYQNSRYILVHEGSTNY